MNKNSDNVVSVKDVSKIFKLPLEKHSTLKSAIISFRHKKKRYSLQKALEKVDFEVKEGEFYGIIGRNGSGKSTLLKLLAGIYYPSTGDIKINGNLTPFIELGVGFNPELTGRENIYLNGALLGFNRKEMDEMYEEIVDFAELEQFMDQKLKNYSSGMQVRLAFSIAIRARSEILLIDEVLAVGDLLFQQKCYDTFKEIKRQGRTVIFVSHDLGAVDSFCDRVMLLNRGEQIGIGEPKEMIAEYKSLLAEEDEARKSAGKKGVHIVSSGNLNITKAEVICNGEKTKNVPEGRPFTIRVHYNAKKRYSKPTFGLGIMDSKENSIMGPNTRETNFVIESLEGKGYVDASFDPNVLSPGFYTIRAGFFDETGVVPEDFVENLSNFKVTGKTRYGQIFVKPTWKVRNEK
jgi:ABC-2 type transport system ATP-binding protein